MVGRKSEIKELNRFSGASDSGDDFDIWSPPKITEAIKQ